MKRRFWPKILKLWAGFFLGLVIHVSGFAQASLKDINIDYNKTYQLDAGYSIIYDNPAEAAKLKEFKIEFYGPGQIKVGESASQTYPPTGTTVTYTLPTPIRGFKAAKIVILSLHAGDIANFPNKPAILALIQPTEITNNPPNAQNFSIDIDASSETITRDISAYLSDPDGAPPTVTPKSVQSGPLTYTLENNGVLIIQAPLITGNHIITYDVKDSEDAKASGRITVNVALPHEIETALETYSQSLSQLQSQIAQKESGISDYANPAADLVTRRDQLLAKIQALSEQTKAPKFATERQEITELSGTLSSSTDTAQLLSDLAELKASFAALQTKLGGIETLSAADGVNLQALQSQLAQLGTETDDMGSTLSGFDVPTPLTAAQMTLWEDAHAALEQKVMGGGFARILWLIGGLIGAAILGLASWFFLRRPKPEALLTKGLKSKISQHGSPPHPPKSGVVFPESPVIAAATLPGPAPLLPTGQMLPSGLQNLTGQFSVLMPAYRATGRIGGPQEGIPTEDDVSFGTGFLITPNHIMTNQHVYEFYKHYLTGQDCGGIEFIAEKDRDASDYVAFNGKAPVIIPELDIAIFTLARVVTNRAPIERIAIPTDDLDSRDIVTVSYPCPFDVDDHILSVVEEDPVFAVKRLSQGKVFRHSTDTDTPYGVNVPVEERINAARKLEAICHNASTLGGSSGAPLLDLKGNLVGVHFAGDRVFNGQEAANLAMAIERLAHIEPPQNIKDKTA